MTFPRKTTLVLGIIFALAIGYLGSTSAGHAKEIVVFNDCDDFDIQLALRIRQDGSWITESWWSFEPGAIHTLYDHGEPVSTDNRVAYFYAEGENTVWSGREANSQDRTYEVGERELRFRRFEFTLDEDNNYFLKISCADTTRQLLAEVIEDNGAPEFTELRIVYKPFVYAYAYLVDKRRYPHIYLVAINPKNRDKSYYTDAGKAGFKRKVGNRNCRDAEQLCSVVRNAKRILNKWQNQQKFFVNLPFSEVVERMERYSEATNVSMIDYRYYDRNCAGYVFSFIRDALNLDITPHPPINPGDDIKVLGWKTDLGVEWRSYKF